MPAGNGRDRGLSHHAVGEAEPGCSATPDNGGDISPPERVPTSLGSSLTRELDQPTPGGKQNCRWGNPTGAAPAREGVSAPGAYRDGGFRQVLRWRKPRRVNSVGWTSITSPAVTSESPHIHYLLAKTGQILVPRGTSGYARTGISLTHR